MTNLIATNSVTRRYLKRGELMAKRRAEAAPDTSQETSRKKLSRVDVAISLGSLRDSNTGGSACLPDVGLYAAGYRNSKDSVTAR
ncbi:hypothetical protein [Lelliottia sp. JS-SCA-14]|uniref:transcriptional antitermination N peptide n=1 Tax=Lelliottia sp. JS-SCA-14 TaxID=3110110 RepID=UPI002D76BD8F|nr:hypothetical protein [Lelliottia sp. JS-SCA-14]